MSLVGEISGEEHWHPTPNAPTSTVKTLNPPQLIHLLIHVVPFCQGPVNINLKLRYTESHIG